MEDRFQARLQVPTGDLLGDAIRDRRDAQRSRATVCLPIPTKSPANSEMMSPGVRNDVAWLAGALLTVDLCQSWGWWSILWGRSDASASQNSRRRDASAIRT